MDEVASLAGRPSLDIRVASAGGGGVSVVIGNEGPVGVNVYRVGFYYVDSSGVVEGVKYVDVNRYLPVGGTLNITLPGSNTYQYTRLGVPLRIIVDTDKGLYTLAYTAETSDTSILVKLHALKGARFHVTLEVSGLTIPAFRQQKDNKLKSIALQTINAGDYTSERTIIAGQDTLVTFNLPDIAWINKIYKQNIPQTASSVLFYWSAHDWMDIESSTWWHGDKMGYYKMTTPDDAWSIDTVGGAGGIQIPKWHIDVAGGYINFKDVVFTFLVYMPPITNGYVNNTKNFPVIGFEGIYSAGANSFIGLEVTIKSITTDDTVYYFTTGPVLGGPIDISNSNSVPFTAYLNITSSKLVWMAQQDSEYQNVTEANPPSIRQGWYVVTIVIHLLVDNRNGSATSSIDFGLKSVFMYISSPGLW